MIDVAAIAAAPRRRISGRFWHQGSPRRPVESFPDPARGDGRYHVAGGPGVWYASNQEQAAWAELLRHFLDDDVDPFEVRRRIGPVTVTNLDVLDLTSPAVRDAIGVTEPAAVTTDQKVGGSSPSERTSERAAEGAVQSRISGATSRPESCALRPRRGRHQTRPRTTEGGTANGEESRRQQCRICRGLQRR